MCRRAAAAGRRAGRARTGAPLASSVEARLRRAARLPHAQAVLEALRSAGLARGPAGPPPAHTPAKASAAAAPVPGRGRRRARWRLVVAAGLLAAPFFPAANVLFPVGTFIGERLLYAPSVGFCVLAAGGLARLAGPHLPRLLLLWAPAGPGAPHTADVCAHTLRIGKAPTFSCHRPGQTEHADAGWLQCDQLLTARLVLHASRQPAPRGATYPRGASH